MLLKGDTVVVLVISRCACFTKRTAPMTKTEPNNSNPEADTLRYGTCFKAAKIIGRVKSRYFSVLRPTDYSTAVADLATVAVTTLLLPPSPFRLTGAPCAFQADIALVRDTNLP